MVGKAALRQTAATSDNWRRVLKHRSFLLSLVTNFSCFAQDPQLCCAIRAVKAALDAAKTNEPKTIERQVQVCGIAAPPFHETARGMELQRLFTSLGLKNVHIDKAGNVIGTRPGLRRVRTWFSARISTPFFRTNHVKVSREGTDAEGTGHRRRLPRTGGDARHDPGLG